MILIYKRDFFLNIVCKIMIQFKLGLPEPMLNLTYEVFGVEQI